MIFVPAKRRLQHIVLEDAMKKLRRKNLRILCLPGEEAWDFEFFSQYKNVSEIVGLEIKTDIYDKIKSRGSKRIKVLRQMTSDHLMEARKPYDLIYLDYMSTTGHTLDFDMRTILRRKLIRPGGFIVMALYGNRGGPGTTCAGKVAYSNFCEQLGQKEEEGPKYQRFIRLAWNSIAGMYHLVPVSPKGHYVKTSVPTWLNYKIETARMFCPQIQILGYPSTPQTKILQSHKKEWLLKGINRVCEEVQADNSGNE